MALVTTSHKAAEVRIHVGDLDLVSHVAVGKTLGLEKKRVDSKRTSNYYYIAGLAVRKIALIDLPLAMVVESTVAQNSRVHLPVHKRLS